MFVPHTSPLTPHWQVQSTVSLAVNAATLGAAAVAKMKKGGGGGGILPEDLVKLGKSASNMVKSVTNHPKFQYLMELYKRTKDIRLGNKLNDFITYGTAPQEQSAEQAIKLAAMAAALVDPTGVAGTVSECGGVRVGVKSARDCATHLIVTG